MSSSSERPNWSPASSSRPAFSGKAFVHAPGMSTLLTCVHTGHENSPAVRSRPWMPRLPPLISESCASSVMRSMQSLCARCPQHFTNGRVLPHRPTSLATERRMELPLAVDLMDAQPESSRPSPPRTTLTKTRLLSREQEGSSFAFLTTDTTEPCGSRDTLGLR